VEELMSQDRANKNDASDPTDEVADTRVLEPESPAAEDESVAADERDDPLGALRAELATHQDNHLRAVAELDNVRKRAARDVEAARRYGLERFATELLPVRDSLEAGIAAAEGSQDNPLLEGSQATLRLLDRVLEQFHISEIDPLGEPFDPQKHEAMTMQPSAEAQPDSVLIVVQKGYQLNDRLLRPARVVVCAGPPDGETE
jgi:molecular chaperone GrpE